uniref:Uncharacterized protein n=1 Tax=Panagrolaimus superbus TaxID=310955 RepID=A0A914Y235_9BILA
MLHKIEFLPIILILLSIAFFAQTYAASISNREAAVRSVLLRQFLDRYQPSLYHDHEVARRFDVNFDSEPQMSKRNNAELVNHIIKNFGAIDRLGDVGK